MGCIKCGQKTVGQSKINMKLYTPVPNDFTVVYYVGNGTTASSNHNSIKYVDLVLYNQYYVHKDDVQAEWWSDTLPELVETVVEDENLSLSTSTKSKKSNK